MTQLKNVFYCLHKSNLMRPVFNAGFVLKISMPSQGNLDAVAMTSSQLLFGYGSSPSRATDDITDLLSQAELY